MNHRRSILCVVAACLVAGLATACGARFAKLPGLENPFMRDRSVKQGEPTKLANCRQRIYDTEAVLYGGELRDGSVHFRIAYNFDVEPEHRKAFQGGMALWNAHKNTTGFAFEEATSPTIDIRVQRGAPAYVKEEKPDGTIVVDEERIKRTETEKCAEYFSSGSYIWYSRNILNEMKSSANWLKSDVGFLLLHDRDFKALAKVYAHELGHALNIDHKTTKASLMREGDEDKSCRELGLSVIADIQPDDVDDARDCAGHVRKNLREPGATRRP